MYLYFVDFYLVNKIRGTALSSPYSNLTVCQQQEYSVYNSCTIDVIDQPYSVLKVATT